MRRHVVMAVFSGVLAGSALGVEPPMPREHVSAALADVLEQVAEQTGVPAIAAAVMTDGELASLAVVGTRSIVTREPAEPNDAFHIGSISKSMTATVIGRLVDEGSLRFEATLGELLPDVEVHERYRDVTVLDLMQHRGGAPALTSPDPEIEAAMRTLDTDPAGVRAAFTKLVLERPPASPPGEMVYSNGGYGILGHLAERASGESWEALVARVIFEPLDFERGGIGWPDPDGSASQPRGHLDQGAGLQTLPPGIYQLGAHVDPAGDIHCTIEDLVRYGEAHRVALGGRATIVEAETARRLHTPPAEGNYACGWVVRETPGMGMVHEHNGSAGTFFAQLVIIPESKRIVAVAANSGAGAQAVEFMIRRLAGEN